MATLRRHELSVVVLAVITGCLLSTLPAAHAQTVLRGVKVIHEVKHDVSLPLREMAKMVEVPNHTNREIELRTHAVIKQLPGEDTAVQTENLPPVSTTGLLNFDGQAADGASPPDTEGAVGGTQYVQWVNVRYNVYDKATGALILGPVLGNAFWAGFGGSCQSSNSGDPIVLYDKAAQRWFVSQPVFTPPYMYCIAVSTTSDATGSYNRYAFATSPAADFPDYPKWAVWPDAYYSSVNEFVGNTNTHDGMQACAADRANMLAGNAATLQCFNEPVPNFGMLPSDLDGNTPPPVGSPDYYIGLGVDTSHLNMWQFHVDWTNPANSSFTGPTPVRVPNYTLICVNGPDENRSCIPEPSPGELLASLPNRMMYRFAYRNLGDHEALVAAHTVKPGAGSAATSAIRWYEIRTPKTPTVFQAGTVQHPSISIWCPGIAMDKNGDIAMGLSASSTSLDPSIGYVGRVPTDASNKMEAPVTVVAGGGVQIATQHRWGDYSAMQIDPADDCTFWFTTEYMKTSGVSHWSTRINSFKFKSCH